MKRATTPGWTRPRPQAALRELEEETGHRASEVREILSYYPSYGCGNQKFVLFLADDGQEAPSDFDRNEPSTWTQMNI